MAEIAFSQSLHVAVVCDASARACVEVKAGTGWARVAVHIAPPLEPVQVLTLLKTGANMLAAAGVTSPRLTTVSVGGPDADAAHEQRATVRDIWARVAPKGALDADTEILMKEEDKRARTAELLAKHLSFDEPDKKSTIRASAPTTSVWAQTTSPSPLSWGPSPKTMQATSAEQTHSARVDPQRERLIAEMVRTVQKHVAEFGANPDFASEKLDVIRKSHNHIKSVTTRQNVSQDVLEEVRIRLANAKT